MNILNPLDFVLYSLWGQRENDKDPLEIQIQAIRKSLFILDYRKVPPQSSVDFVSELW